jgi:hypothetical protein
MSNGMKATTMHAMQKRASGPGWTPGPWQKSGVRSRSPEYKGHAVGPDGRDPVVVVPYTDRHHGECIANANLIAAAPELYEAAENLIIAIGMGWDLDGVVDVAKSAIAKTRGETP